jgi:hypothetical protein
MNHQSNWEEEFKTVCLGDLRTNEPTRQLVKSFIASVRDSAREEGRREERREILAALTDMSATEPFPDYVNGYHDARDELRTLLASRASSERGECCPGCVWLNNDNTFGCRNSHCHSKKAV